MPGKVADDILQGAREALAFAQGKPVEVRVHSFVDVKAIRKKLNMTQRIFAEAFNFSIDTIKHWEAGRRTPDRSAQTLLKLIEQMPQSVLAVTRSGAQGPLVKITPSESFVVTTDAKISFFQEFYLPNNKITQLSTYSNSITVQ